MFVLFIVSHLGEKCPLVPGEERHRWAQLSAHDRPDLASNLGSQAHGFVPPAHSGQDAPLVELQADASLRNLQIGQLLRFPCSFASAISHGHDVPQPSCRAVNTKVPHDIMDLWAFGRQLLLQEPLGRCVGDHKASLLLGDLEIILFQQLSDVLIGCHRYPCCIGWISVNHIKMDL